MPAGLSDRVGPLVGSRRPPGRIASATLSDPQVNLGIRHLTQELRGSGDSFPGRTAAREAFGARRPVSSYVVTNERKRVLLTGATGAIGSQLAPALREAYDLRMIDVKDNDRDGHALDGVEIFDLVERSDGEVVDLFTGLDAIVHCGYLQPTSETGSYADERRNLDMTERIYRLGVAAGVRRVVAASTNQAAKWYERPWLAGRIDRVTPHDYPKPDTFYGWAKVAYESLGFLYACGSLGSSLEVVQLRIVVPREVDAGAFADRPLASYLRDITGYISQRDLQQLFIKSVDAASIDDQFGVPFQIFYGVSDNARTFWSITNAREVIGYAPEDDSEVRFADDIARMLARG